MGTSLSKPLSNQFFDEAQWESYRKLGFSIAERLFTEIRDGDAPEKWQPFTMSPVSELLTRPSIGSSMAASADRF